MLVENGLVALTWGNASGIDRERGLVVIKPSGVTYNHMRPSDMVVVDLDGTVVDGTLRPSSDTPSHLALYRAWPEIGGVVHTHSPHATAFAQAGTPIPCFGTTHADFCPGDVPCVRALRPEEVRDGYEAYTGKAIVDHYAAHGIVPMEYPGSLITHHGPFTWGHDPVDAADNALILENIAMMALLTAQIRPGSEPIPDYIRTKHYDRKHGAHAYYGQP